MVEYYVVLGDVVHSREIEDREGFQDRLEAVCAQFNATERDDVWGNFKILKGIDEFGGVLQSLENVYEVVSAFQEELRPHEVRMVVAGGSIDVGGDWDVEKMDGEAFHEASERLEEIEDGPLSFDLLVDDDSLARAVADEINLLLHVRGDWTDRQWEVASVRERVGTQTAAAEELDVTQQAVSNVLSGANWPLVHEVEERLRDTLAEYAESRSSDGEPETSGEEESVASTASGFSVPVEYLTDESDGERFDAASALKMYADDLKEEGKYEEAAEHYERALEEDAEYASVHLAYGNLLLDRGAFDDAEVHYERALELYRAEDDVSNAAGALGGLGLVARMRGDLDAAEEYHEESLAIEREIGARGGVQTSLRNLAGVELERDEPEKAIEYLQQSLDIDPTQEWLVVKYAELATEDGRYDDALDRLESLLESLVGSDGGESFVRRAASNLDDVLEPIVTNASDDEQVESVLSFLVQLAERTTGTASDDLEAWALAQHARVTGTAHDRANESRESPELRASDAYCTALGFFLAEEPANAIQPLKRAWELREDLDESAVEYATSSGVALLGCADLLGPSVLDAEWDDLYEELIEQWEDTLREPARQFLEDAEEGIEVSPEEITDAIHDDDRDQFAELEARAFASLLSMLQEQAEREA
jgi:tetratricopeptide (TPR) repeat protein